MSDISYLEDLGDVMERAVRERQRPVVAGMRRTRRLRARILAPLSASLVLLGTSGATAFSLLTASPSLAAQVVNCNFPGHHAQVKTPTRSMTATGSLAECRDWYRLHLGALTGLDHLAFIVCRASASTVEVYAFTGPATPCTQRGEVSLTTAPLPAVEPRPA